MSRTRALLLTAIIGSAVFGLSFVNAWIVHDMEIRGEGYRHAVILLSAWRSVAVPVLSLGAVAALGAAAGAVALLLRPGSVPGWLTLLAALLAVGLVGASLVPLGRDGHTTSLDLRPAWLGVVGFGLTVALAGVAAAAVRPGRRQLGLLGAAALAVLGAGAGGRAVILAVTAPDDSPWSDGSYARTGSPDGALVMTIADGRYRIGDRWAGVWEGSDGWTVVLDEDPACPGSRGTYHAHAEGEDGVDLRFVMVVDTCEDGARAAALVDGIWERQP